MGAYAWGQPEVDVPTGRVAISELDGAGGVGPVDLIARSLGLVSRTGRCSPPDRPLVRRGDDARDASAVPALHAFAQLDAHVHAQVLPRSGVPGHRAQL